MKNKLLKIINEHKADFLVLENCDKHAFLHYKNSQLYSLTNFSGSAGEAVMNKNGEIFLFVDPRYHIQAEIQAAKGVTVSKVQLGDTFLDAIKKIVPKNAKMLMDCEVSLNKFKKFASVFSNIITVELPKYIHPHSKAAALNVVPVEISGETPKKKISKIQEILTKKNAEMFFISGLEEIAYLTDLRGNDFDNSVQFIAKMVVNKSGAVLFVDHKIPRILDGIEVSPFIEYKKAIASEKGLTLFCPKSITQCDFSLIKNPVELKQNPIAKLMSIKKDGEIEHLKTCFLRLDKALKNFKTQIKSGLSELELKEILESEILKAGAKSLSFKTILAIGQNGASIHYSTYDSQKRLKNGDLILADCGGYYEGGYATDITRVFVCGEPSAEQKRVYTLVLKAFLKAYHSSENSSAKLDKIAREFLKKHAPACFNFPHALGHGIGINVHQTPPTLSPSTKSGQKLKKGMVFSIEPGLYCENKFGVRLENCVYVDDSGRKISLSHFEFEEKLIDEKMLNNTEKVWLKEWQNG